jgi:two-component system, sensor histidine kinase and response regulator
VKNIQLKTSNEKEVYILVVDDVMENIQLVERVFKNTGYTVVKATSGEEAFKVLEEITPNLILLDIEMPGLDGFEICSIIKQNPNTKEIPVIFVTTKNDQETIIKGFRLGAIDYITKPFYREELLLRVKNHLHIQILTKDLKESNKTKDKFFSIIAHDLRSPLSGLLGISQILLDDIDDMSKQEILEISGQISNSAKKLFNLLENLLEWSRVQTGGMKNNPDTIQLSDLFDNIEGLFVGVAFQKQIELELASFKEDISIYADENILFTILRNLVSNALKFTPAGGTVSVTYKLLERYIEICVSDTGVGMDEEAKQKVFRLDETHSTPGTNQEKGTGLGLVLVKDLVTVNRGSLYFESAVNCGSQFYFTIPRTKEVYESE